MEGIVLMEDEAIMENTCVLHAHPLDTRFLFYKSTKTMSEIRRISVTTAETKSTADRKPYIVSSRQAGNLTTYRYLGLYTG